MQESTYARIYREVRRVPEGRVATYGQISALAGTGNARQVGYALHSLRPGTDVPWHRVINAQGRISVRSDGSADRGQRALLEAEGIVFDKLGRISLQLYQWEG